jgi:hypothetical protein
LIGDHYYSMICEAVGNGQLPPCMTKGLVSVLHKGVGVN